MWVPPHSCGENVSFKNTLHFDFINLETMVYLAFLGPSPHACYAMSTTKHSWYFTHGNVVLKVPSGEAGGLLFSPLPPAACAEETRVNKPVHRLKPLVTKPASDQRFRDFKAWRNRSRDRSLAPVSLKKYQMKERNSQMRFKLSQPCAYI